MFAVSPMLAGLLLNVRVDAIPVPPDSTAVAYPNKCNVVLRHKRLTGRISGRTDAGLPVKRC